MVDLSHIERFLSAADAHRALSTFEKLTRHDIGAWTLTGGFAIEIHRLRQGLAASVRALNDIDFIAADFDAIPKTLADDFLFRHIHPLDPPGKTMVQCVDPETAVRVDVFRAYGGTMSRGHGQLISLEDLVARSARLALDIAQNVPTPSKHARDFCRLAALVDPADVETAWRDHRKPAHPATFTEANRVLQDLIPRRADLLVAVEYSKDTEAVCPRCAPPVAGLHLADPKLVLALLGYC